MSKIKVVFHDMEEVNTFVNIVNKYPVSMMLERGDLKVGATSILGIINLGINKVMSLDVPEGCMNTLGIELENFIAA